MNTRIELGRIAGIPIVLDMFFVLVLLLFSSRYFTSGNTQMVSAGFVIVIGLLLSVLLHELGHAFAGRLYGTSTRFIELTGLGGVCHFDSSLPGSVLARTVIYLAGPAANLVLWLGLGELAESLVDTPMLAVTLSILASVNFYMLVFNLMPAFPLDGGQTLHAWLAPLLGAAWSVRVVASLGLLVAAGCVLQALPMNFFMLLLAFVLFQVNWSALQSVGGFRGR